MTFRKTKIVCTLGPATHDLDILKHLLQAGMNVARFNFSHGDHAYHGEMMAMVRKASRETGIPVALLLDTKGPEIRTGVTKDNKPLQLTAGNTITLTTEEVEGTEDLLSVSYANLPSETKVGKHIYIADGTIDLKVEQIEGKRILCRIRQGGSIGSRKNVNVVGVRTSLPAMTEKDRQDIVFGIEQGIDFIAASFVRKSSDILEIRKILNEYRAPIQLIAKIEDEEGVENLSDILALSDGVMVARGDLGVQLNTAQIPLVQKRIIQHCNQANKPVITATQMLDSMIHNSRPTRAETSDVANAIFDGTDAVMLSGETASGKYPVLAVQTMHQIAVEVENSPEYAGKIRTYFDAFGENPDIATAIAKAAFITAGNVKASAIITPSIRGNTPRLISRYRPNQKIIAAITTEQVQRQLLLYWGIDPILTGEVPDSDTMTCNAIKIALQQKSIRNFDRVVMVAGIPVKSPVMLNTIRVQVISTILGKGRQGCGTFCTGRIVKAQDLSEAVLRIQGDGNEILLTPFFEKGFAPLLRKVAGLILEEHTTASIEELQMINPDLVAILGVPDVLSSFEDDLIVTLDGEEKLIYEGVVAEEA